MPGAAMRTEAPDMPKRVRYQVAASLDGFIADPNGGYDWIVGDPRIDFKALYAEFDTAIMGRKTYDLMASQGDAASMPGIEVIAFSRTLPPKRGRGVRVTNEDPATVVRQLKAEPGRDIWLFGGGELFRTLLDAGVVDTVEIAVMPVLLGSGIPVLPPGAIAKLVLADQKILPDSGIAVLAYVVADSDAAPPRIRYVKPGKQKTTKPKPARRRR
jgi:dihydrofolate reductase